MSFISHEGNIMALPSPSTEWLINEPWPRGHCKQGLSIMSHTWHTRRVWDLVWTMDQNWQGMVPEMMEESAVIWLHQYLSIKTLGTRGWGWRECSVDIHPVWKPSAWGGTTYEVVLRLCPRAWHRHWSEGVSQSLFTVLTHWAGN